MTPIVPLVAIRAQASFATGSGRHQDRRRIRCGLALAVTAVGHTIAITATVYFAKLHAYIQASRRLQIDIQQLGPHLLSYFNPVQAFCTIVHALTLTSRRLDFASHWIRRSQRASLSQRWTNSLRRISVSGPKPTSLQSQRPRCWKRVYACLKHGLTSCRDKVTHSRVYTRLASVLKVYNVELVQVQLLVEIMMQSYQANKMSNLIASVWLNRALVFVIVLNCWFAPSVYWLMRRRSGHEKLVVHLSVDTVLDILYNFGIPCVILFPYWRDFVPALGGFPIQFYIMDTWTTVAGSELQQIFVYSWWDFISKVSPWFFFCYRLHALRRIVGRDPKPSNNTGQHKPNSYVSRVLAFTLLAWGLGVLVVHLQGSYVANTASSEGCLVELRPWCQTSYTCAVVELGCSQRRISGFKHETLAALSVYTPDRVQSLIVSHCPVFAMPPIITSFAAVAMFKFYNSIIFDWGNDAVLTAATNPNVQQFFSIETNDTVFPEGLLSPQMTKSIRDVKFVATNLTTLPKELAVAWRGVKYFTVEHSPQMTVFPVALTLLPELIYVAFANDGLQYLEETTARSLRILWFSLDGNPLENLPEHIGNLDSIVLINVRRTRVSSLPPSWQSLRRETRLQIIADETPLCDQLQASAGYAQPFFLIGQLKITYTDIGYSAAGYPLSLEREWREQNRYPDSY